MRSHGDCHLRHLCGRMSNSCLVLLLLLLSSTSAQPLDAGQHSALMDVYKGLGCNNTTCPQFIPSSNCSGPVICIGGKVTQLSVHRSLLTGTISSAIGQLTALTYLWLYENQLGGPIPTTIGQLTALQQLYLNFNQLNGTIPPSIGQLTVLAELFFHGNRLDGTIPSTIGLLPMLIYLFLHDNQLDGTIPSTIGQLSSLAQLWLYNNQLDGAIPSMIGNLPLSDCRLQEMNDMNCLNCTTRPSLCSCITPACVARTTLTTSSPMTTTVVPTTTAAPTTGVPSSSAARSTVATSTSSSRTGQPVTLLMCKESTLCSSCLEMPSCKWCRTAQESVTGRCTENVGGCALVTLSTIGCPTSASSSSSPASTAVAPMGILRTTAMIVDSTHPPEIDAALVGGVVSGIVALVVVIAVVAYVVMRMRQSKANKGDNGRAMQHPSADLQSHAPRPPAINSNYDRIVVPSHHYSERAVVPAAPTSHYAALEPNEIGA